MDILRYKRVMTWSRELDGVFAIQDLKVVFNQVSPASMYREIQALEESGDLVRVKKGFYAAPDAALSTISARMYPKSYISTGTALAECKVIGSIPERKIQVVQIGTPASLSCPIGTIELLSISPKLFFGFERREDAYWATAEKAYLDCCYYYYKGKRFSFDLESDVDRSLLDVKLIKQYLAKYDQRFVNYFWTNFWGMT